MESGLAGVLIIGGTILFIWQLQVLRTLLSFIVPDIEVFPLRSDALKSLPSAVSELYQKAIEELMALGFSSPHWIMVKPDTQSTGHHTSIRAFLYHKDKGTLVCLKPPHIALPNQLEISFTTRFTDGRRLTSYRELQIGTTADEHHVVKIIGGKTIENKQPRRK